MRAIALPVFACAAITLSACDRPLSQSPSAPTPPLQAVPRFTINGLPTSLPVGQSVQLTASLTLQGVPRLLTTEATWKSSDSAVATVSSTGMLTGVGGGDVDITASAYEHEASVRLRSRWVIAGVVHESRPTEDLRVAGARVEMQGGLDSGASVITDGDGRFRLEAQAAGFTLAVSKDGYEPATLVIAALPRDERPDIGLVPDARRAQSAFVGRLCTIEPPIYPSQVVCSGNNFPYPLEARYPLTIHRAGTATVSVKYEYAGDYYWNYLSFQLRCDGRAVASQTIANLWDTHPDNTGPFQVTLDQPCAYEVRLFDYIADRKGGSWTSYTVEINHPK